MTGDQLEQIKRILEPAIRETVRTVMEEEFVKFVDRVEALEATVAELKQLRGKMFGVWTLIVFIASLVGKAAWDWVSLKVFPQRP